MYRKSLLMLLVVAVATVFMVGCSDDDDNNPTGGNNTPTAQTPAIVEAMTQLAERPLVANLLADTVVGNGGYGPIAASYIGMAGVANFWMTPPASASKEILPSLALADTVTYTFPVNQLTVTMLWIETSSEWVWKSMVNGTKGTLVYTDFLVVEAHQDLAGTSGWMMLYDPDQSGEYLRWEWSESGGVFTMTLTGVDGVDTEEVTLVVNADGSGYVEVTDGTEYCKITWNAAGTSGTWIDGTESGVWPYTG